MRILLSGKCVTFIRLRGKYRPYSGTPSARFSRDDPVDAYPFPAEGPKPITGDEPMVHGGPGRTSGVKERDGYALRQFDA